MAFVAFVALVCGASTQTAAAHADTDYPVLAGVTTVQTSTSGFARVRLAQPVTVNFKQQFGPAGSRVVGNGRITAIYLEQKAHIVAGYIHVRPCTTPGCSDPGFGFPWFGSHSLAPGLYNLYVVADGAPVTATLSLNGPPGATTVAVAPDPDIDLKAFTPLLPSTGVADPALYSADADGTIGPHGGLLVNSTWIDVASYVADYDDVCAARGAAPPAYVAGCSLPSDPFQATQQVVPYTTCDPTAFCDPGFTADAALFGFGSFMDVFEGTGGPSLAGPWSQGRYFEGAAVLNGAGGNGLWLPFAADPGSASSAPVSPAAAPATPGPSPSPAASPPAVAAISLPDTSSGPAAPGVAGAAVCGLAALLLVRRRRRL